MNFQEWFESEATKDFCGLIQFDRKSKELAQAAWLASNAAAQQDVQATGLYCQHCGDLMSDHLISERGGACLPPRA
jgi:hypothetical protein